MKKVMTLVLSLSLIMNLCGNYLAAADKSSQFDSVKTDKEVKALSEINILKGDGVSFNLDGELTRAEGATFIVRLMGKESQILDNKIDYMAKDFTDVYGSSWFSPYVGYCVQKGIINGYIDKTFRPQDKLSEQAFVKMVLGAMGYEYGSDFTWTKVFSFAYDHGILTDDKYDGLTSSTEKYTREKVIKLLYHVLSEKRADGSGTMIGTLIDAKVLSEEKAKEYGFVTDSIIMNVESMVQTKNKFILLFNEPPKELTPDNILIKGRYSDDTLEVTKVTEADVPRKFYITTAMQEPDFKYQLLINDVKDSEGNEMDVYSFDFLGYREDSFDSNYFRIVSVKHIAKNMLDVLFTHPLAKNRIRPEQVAIYQNNTLVLTGSDTNMSLSVDSENPYIMHIELLKGGFNADEDYELVLDSEAKSLYGTQIKDGRSDSAMFVTGSYEREDFTLADSYLEDEHNLVIIFNRMLNETIAKQIFSYYLMEKDKTPIVVTTVEVIGSGAYAYKAVRLTTESELKLKEDYRLMVNQAYDTDRTESIIEEEFNIEARQENATDISIESITLTSGSRMEIVLDQYISGDEVLDVDNYEIKDLKNKFYVPKPVKVFYHSDTKKPTIVLGFDDKKTFTNGHEYSVTIESNIKDSAGRKINNRMSKTFEASTDNYYKTGLVEADYIGTNTIRIRASEEFALEVPNVLATNYTLVYVDDDNKEVNMEPIGVNYIGTNCILLRFDEIDPDIHYMLHANKIVTGFGNTLDLTNQFTNVNIEEIVE